VLAGDSLTFVYARQWEGTLTNRPFSASAAAAAAGLAVIGLATAACGTSAPAPRPTITKTVTSSASPSPTQLSPGAGGTSPSLPPTPTPAPGSGQAAGCLTRYLNGTTGQSQGTAGSIYVNIVFKNLNNVPCTLYGFPGVALAAGTPVTDIGKASVESKSSSRVLVTLPPGGYAYATLQIVDAGNFPAAECKIRNSTWLEVIPPNQQVPLNIPLKSQACQGTAQLLTVTAVRPGKGG
jgi:hypothetical protein